MNCYKLTWTSRYQKTPQTKQQKPPSNFYFKFCNEKSCEVCAFQKCIPSISNSWGPSSALHANVLKKFPFFMFGWLGFFWLGFFLNFKIPRPLNFRTCRNHMFLWWEMKKQIVAFKMLLNSSGVFPIYAFQNKA